MHNLSFIKTATWLCSCLIISLTTHAQNATIAATPHPPSPITLHIDLRQKAQTIDNIGASGCWYSEAIGRYWPQKKREQIAEWLFSKDFDEQGNPKGIGLSAWRFNIGGGTAEQGDSSGIKDVPRRVECFLGPGGSYDWTKQSGYMWFVKKAHDYGVENLIAFSNTPPVQFTQNGLGYKTEKDLRSNLAPDKYPAYADFLASVIQHFDAQGIRFNYISPVNEPQWAWADKFGEASQEGSPWSNAEIKKIATALDSALESRHLTSQILLAEAGMLTYLYAGSGATAHQIRTFFGKQSPLQLHHVPHLLGAHSYFTDAGDSTLVNTRKSVADTARAYGVDYWETEYSMLGNGYKEGATGKRSAIDCALFLAKVIHNDLAVGNASAWQLWNAYEPGSPDADTRYYLIALHPDTARTDTAHPDTTHPDTTRTGEGVKGWQPRMSWSDGDFHQTKALWAMGNFSRFIRPGMQRLLLSRSDHPTDIAAAGQVMLSAYTDEKQVILVAINYTTTACPLDIHLDGQHIKGIKQYVTSAAPEDNLKLYPAPQKPSANMLLSPRSITTFVIKL